MSEAAVVDVVGIHGGEVFGRKAAAVLRNADVVVASARHRELIELGSGQSQVEMAGPLSAVLDAVDDAVAVGKRVVILSSGDPGFFGIVRLVAERFGANAVAVHPAPSSVSLAFGRIGRSWDDALVLSAHGRPIETAVAGVLRSPKAAVLTAPTQPPQLLGQLLIEHGCSARDVVVLTRLGEPGEAITHTDLAGLAAGCFDPMSVVVLLDPVAEAGDGPASLAWGLPEDRFDYRGGMITKAEVRAIALGKLDLPRAGVLWDVGAGSGSVAIECARLAPGLEVIAIERQAEDAQRLADNARRHGVAVRVVIDTAPAAFAGLPTPDRVFVGGGGLDVLRQALQALRPGGTLVATHVLVDRAAQAWQLLGNTVQIGVSRSVGIADGFRLQAENPVFLSWGPIWPS